MVLPRKRRVSKRGVVTFCVRAVGVPSLCGIQNCFLLVDADDFDPDAGFAKKEDQWQDEDQDLKLMVGVVMGWGHKLPSRIWLVSVGNKRAGGGR